MKGNEKFKSVPTVCPFCGTGCGINLIVKDGSIVGTEPRSDHPVNEGKNCSKGQNAYKFLNSDERLTKPLIKDNGEFKESSWEKILDLISERIQNEDGRSVGFINSGKLMNEALYSMQKFVRIATGESNIDNCSRFCHSTTVPALSSTVGSGAMPISSISIEEADCIFLVGSNLAENYPLIARRVTRARKKGAKVIVADPRKTASARNIADIHLKLRPGTDIPLVNSMMKVVLEEGLEDGEFIEKRTKGFEELKDHLSGYDSEESEKITGLSIEEISEAAKIYAEAERACILFNAGIAQHRHPVAVGNIQALVDLALMTGNYGEPGTGVNPLRGHINGEGFGDMGPVPPKYPGFRKINEESAEMFEEWWDADDLPTEPGKTYMDMVEDCEILYITGANPMVSAPDTNRVKELLQEKDLIVVQDIFMTETAELADIVLPAAAWAEEEGTVTQVDRRVQKMNKAIDPPGEARPDWKIFCDLAAKMGFGEKLDYDSPEEIFEEIREVIPQYRGINYERLKKAGGIQWPCPSEDSSGTETFYEDEFKNEDGLAHFQTIEYKDPLEVTDEEYSYIFTNGRTIFHYHTGTMSREIDRLNEEVENGFAEINPKDADDLGIENGDEVILESRRGSVQATARVTDNILEGVVFLPFHFSESAANVLTGSDSDPPSKMPEFKFCAIRVSPK